MNDLGETGRGSSGYGSTGISANKTEINAVSKIRATPSDQINSVQLKDKISSDQEPKQIKRFNKAIMNEPTRHTKKRSQTAEARRIMSAARCRN